MLVSFFCTVVLVAVVVCGRHRRSPLIAALDRLRVVAISITSGPGLRIDRHRRVDPYMESYIDGAVYILTP